MSNKKEQWQILILLLKEIAKQKNISQQEIAEKTNLIQSNISRFYSLKYTPTLDTFLKIANAIGVNFYFEDKESETDLNLFIEKAMEEMGRRANEMPKN